MLTRFARLSTRHARAVVIAAVLVFAVAGAIGGGVADHLTSGGFEDPSSESSRADEPLAERFDTGVPNLLLLVTAPGGDVDEPAVAAAGQALTEELAAAEGVADVVSYWSEGNASPLRNDDGSRALVVARVEGNDDQVEDRVTELAPRYERTAADGGVDVEVGGFAEVFHEVGDTIEEDLVRAEMIALPITLVLLILVFGSVVAASLPLVVGVMSIVGTFFVLRGLAALTDVSIYALNLTTALGLGLAIDYSLFVVSRYREELRAGHAPRVAATRTVRTAGRTVAFSALTVAASLCAMLVFPIAFLRSFAYAGVAVALLAGVFSVVVLPAILVLLGHRVNALTLWRRSVTPPEEGFWHRVATVVMRRPIPIATVVVALLLVLGAPFLGLRLASPTPSPASGTRSTTTQRAWRCCPGSPGWTPPPAPTAAPASPPSWAVSPDSWCCRPTARPATPASAPTAPPTCRSCPPSSRCRRRARTWCTTCVTPTRRGTCWSPASRPAWSTPTSRCSTGCRGPSAWSPSSLRCCCS